jgi:cytochrome c oxidase cbb3-type subunit 2
MTITLNDGRMPLATASGIRLRLAQRVGLVLVVASTTAVAGTNYDAARGRALYTANCSACHGPSGEGLPGTYPPLKGSGVVVKDDATKHIHVVLSGLQGAKAGGVLYAAAMPPFGSLLGDVDIADIIDYERSSWGNHGKLVTAAEVAAERASSSRGPAVSSK